MPLPGEGQTARPAGPAAWLGLGLGLGLANPKPNPNPNPNPSPNPSPSPSPKQVKRGGFADNILGLLSLYARLTANTALETRSPLLCLALLLALGTTHLPTYVLTSVLTYLGR